MGVKNKIKELRKQNHITQVEMAKAMQVTLADDSGDWKSSLQSESRVIFKNCQIFWGEGGGNLYAGVRRKKINDKLERFKLE